MNAHWEYFAPGADIGVRGFGATQAAAFEQAALASSCVARRRAASPDCGMAGLRFLNRCAHHRARFSLAKRGSTVSRQCRSRPMMKSDTQLEHDVDAEVAVRPLTGVAHLNNKISLRARRTPESIEHRRLAPGISRVINELQLEP
jgi:hypothetical protein